MTLSSPKSPPWSRTRKIGYDPTSILNGATLEVLPDALPDWYGLHNVPADGRQAPGNPSGDGISNLLKYAFTMAPSAGSLNQPDLRVLNPGFLVLAIISGRWLRFVPVTFMVTFVGLYLDATLQGTFDVWAQLLDTLRLRGDERILELGCGRGAVLLMTAERLTTGRAVGVDLWQRADQSGNWEAATRRNAVAEGVADRVELWRI